MEPFEEEKKQEQIIGSTNKKHVLILFNDDVNSFDDVIDALCEACNFDVAQAEQCALIVHHRGKYPIKSGTIDELIKIKNHLDSRNLSVTKK